MSKKKPVRAKKSASKKSASKKSASNKSSGKKTRKKPSARATKRDAPLKNSEDPLSIVGIGASAGGLAALKAFFDNVPEDSGLAYVVVVHLSPDHESLLAELLQPHVRIPVSQVTATTEIHPNQVYVIPPASNLDTIDTHLRLTEMESQRIQRAPIDHFFRTLAQTHQGSAIGVVLSGTGSDGTLGSKEIKAKAGFVVVQDPNEAEFDGMPQSVIASGQADFILPVRDIPAAILRFVRTNPNLKGEADGGRLETNDRQMLQKVFAQVRSRTGRDFGHYKESTILRRIGRRMQLHQVEQLADYLRYLREHGEEVRALSDELLVTVTSFFRDSDVFDYLKQNLLPKMFAGKGADDDMRVWSVGCATGEEAYSLAMVLLEVAADLDIRPRLQVFASDLHEHSLEKAREGFYPGDIETDVSPERLNRFFLKEIGGYRVRKEVREIVVFAPHNMIGDPPFSRLDLVSCRNVLIYLQREAQREIFQLFHYALNGEGHLLLGSAETIDNSDLFRAENKKLCIYRKRNVQAGEPRLPVFPMNRIGNSGARSQPQPPQEAIAYGALHQKMVERYAPPSVLICPDDRLVHLSEHAGRYLLHPGGDPTTSIFKIIREELRIELRAALYSVKESGRATSTKPVLVRFNGESHPVILHVGPAWESQAEGYVLIIFDERHDMNLPASSSAAPADDERVRELEAEVEQGRQRLQAVIEEFETGQEEMKAANEELQSTNEEFRSTMEELETSKEELQSMNEELQTVNQENRHKVEELAQISSDLSNLLSATNIATLFLDRQLRILRYTPPVAELFNVRHTDRSRVISDFTHRLGYDELVADAQQVLSKLIPLEREVKDEEGHCFLTRILPYRTTEDRIEGVVLTFVDITEQKQTEERLQAAKEYSESIISTLHEPLLVLDEDLNVKTANPAFYDNFPSSVSETVGRHIYEIGNGRWKIPPIQQLLEESLPEKVVVTDFEVRHNFDDLGERVMLINARKIKSTKVTLLGIRDITDRTKAEDQVRKSNDRLQQMINVKGIGVMVFNGDGYLIDCNETFIQKFGYPREEIRSKGIHWRRMTPTEYEDLSQQQWNRFLKTGQIGPYRKEYLHVDGSRTWMLFVGAGLGDGTCIEYCIDVSEYVSMEEQLRHLNETLEEQVKNRTEVLDILQDITRAANEANSVSEVMKAAMRRITRYNGWSVGHVWRLAEDDSGDLVSSGHLYVAPEDELAEAAPMIRQIFEGQRLKASDDFVGEVLLSGQPMWIDEVSPDWREGVLQRLSLHSVIAFPVFAMHRTVAVMEFFSRHPAKREDQFLQIMPDVGMQVGHVIERNKLERRVVDATESEQRRLGSDIHDGVGQELTGLRHLAQTLAETLATEQSRGVEIAERIGVALGQVQRQLRTVIRDLVPIEIDEHGLKAALESLAARTSEQYDLQCKVEIATDLDVQNTMLATHVYRIIQEAVANASRHSKASEILITATGNEREIQLEVSDNGVGFDQPPEKGGFGLRIMNFRANVVGAQLFVERGEAAGTVVRCLIPRQKL